MRALERAVVHQAMQAVAHDADGLLPEGLRAVVNAYLSDEARRDRASRESCGSMSPGWSMECKRPKGHLLDSDRPHEGFDARGYRRHWAGW